MSQLRRTGATRGLQALVLGIFVGIIGVTAGVQALLVTQQFTTSMLTTTVGNDTATVRSWVDEYLSLTDLAPGPAADQRAPTQIARLATLASPDGMARIEIRSVTDRVLLSNIADLRGSQSFATPDFTDAMTGATSAALLDASSGVDQSGPSLGLSSVLREYIPLETNGKVGAVFVVWRDGAPIVARLVELRLEILLVTLVAATAAAIVLMLVFRGAQRRLNRQTQEVVAATQRDPLTWLLNHGAVVEELTNRIASADATTAQLGILLLDIDNFRALNETQGRAAGDAALRSVAEVIQQACDGWTAGRYGPDEFLVIPPVGSPPPTVAAAARSIRVALANSGVELSPSERLPITASIGIATFPVDARSVTALLATVAVALAEAKASGGNAVCQADSVRTAPRESGFSILQGLVIAVDTKDRYTKHHSDDVARYSVFLAGELGLSADVRETIRVAGLLHDVGKIGIPDSILRKPGRLDDAEIAIMQQHVALGDAIVRDLPNVETVRSAIRHHHERWDGGGYLDHLEGTAIPMIARLISVADAFSAMTTSRPYRKALDVDEALRRLEDAAGHQLDEALVAAFVRGLRTSANPPLPGEAHLGLSLIHAAVTP